MKLRALAAFLLFAVFVTVTPLLAGNQLVRCGTRTPSDEEIATIEKALAHAKGHEKASVVIPTWVHVINKGEGFENGDVPEYMIRAQIKVLNDSYSGKTGGAPTSFGFELAGITRTTNEDWFNNFATDFEVELAAKKALKTGGPGTLNFYLVDASPWLGWAYFPQIVNNTLYSALDGVVVDYRSVPFGPFAIYSEGDTGTHEVGHWLALYHTFDGGCSAFGDYVADTNSEMSPAFNCPVGRDTCKGRPGLDPIRNFMDYTQDSCMYEFSNGQVDRMKAAWAAFRN